MKKMIDRVLSLLLFLNIVSFRLCLSSASTDAQQLLNFKAKVLEPNLLNSWKSTGSVCSFSGVHCKDGTHVSEIDLSFAPVSANIVDVAALLMSLGSLESLSLRGSNLTGPFSSPAPNSACSSSLLDLDLSANALSGSVHDLSGFFSSCSCLKSLNLSSNYIDFSGSGSKVFQLNYLESLDLSYNRVAGGNVVDYLVSGGCKNLTYLSLKGNKVSGNLSPIWGCSSLEYLDVSFNNFSSEVTSFGHCSALHHLDLSENRFYGEIGNALLSCENLILLNISINKFSGQVPAVPSANLQYLYLSGNDFSGNVPSYLSDACKTLLELDLSTNSLSGMLPAELASCTSLESIDLSSNNFSGEFPVDLFQKIGNLKNLVVSFNNFSGILPDSFSGLPNLETLDVSSNAIGGLVPSGLCQGPDSRLKVLYLQNNAFVGRVPVSIGNCSELVSLDLSFNYLMGTIPASIGTLSKLQDLIIWFNSLEGEIPQELMSVRTLENLVLDFNMLTGNIPTGLSNCTNLNWISLSNNQLSGTIPAWIGQLSNLSILKLSNNSFSGNIPPELGDCKSLIWLDLNTNQLNGSIPPALFKQSGNIAVGLVTGKRYAYIKTDGSKTCHGAGNLLEFNGIRQLQLTRLSTRNPCNFTRVYGGMTQPNFNNNGSMLFLDISYNLLSGSIPKEIGVMYYLYVLNLGHNALSGDIPPEIGDIKWLNILDLSSNMLQGPIPSTFSELAMLTEVDVSNNNLSGPLPSGQFETLPAHGFDNNSGLCGIPLPPCGGPASSNLEHQKSNKRHASLAGSVAMGLLFALFCIFGLIIVAVETKKRRKKKDSTLDIYIDGNSHSHSGTTNTGWKLTGAREALSINLATFEKPLWKLTFHDLMEATNGFHNDSLIGSGGFGDVYKAQLKDGSIVAIKKLIHVSGQGDREFTAEMETIGKIKHRNLVPLLGYCKVGEERLLVYEYMKYGSLEDVLHDRRKAGIKLSWTARRKIAIGAARGLAFLHHNCIPHIIHRDMKSSNVLLDDNLEARVSDFGMARLMSAMDTHLSVSTLAGTPGYVPPEYYQSFRCSTKGDVYSYGVVLLELLTGKQPTDSADFGDNNLVGWVKQHAKLRISDVFDPELLKEDPSLEIELLQHLKVACACLDDRSMRRPTMIQVMAMFKEIQTGSGLDSTSTIAVDDGSFTAEMIDMTIKEAPELCSKQ